MPTAHEILRNKGHAVHSVRPNDTVLSALSVMAEHDIGAVLVLGHPARAKRALARDVALELADRVRHLPVVENRRVVGVISIGDLVKAMIDEQEFTIRELKSYIAG